MSNSARGTGHLVFTDETGMVPPSTSVLMEETADRSDRGVERGQPPGRLGIPEEDPDLLAQLVDEEHAGIGFRDGGRELAQGLTHQARLQAHLGVPHLAFQLGLGDKRRHRIDHDDVHGAGTDQDFGDLQGLLAGVGLRDQQVVEVDA